MFWAPSPAVAEDPSRAPSRDFARPRSDAPQRQSDSHPARARALGVDQGERRLRGDVGSEQKKLAPTSFWARRSAASDDSRPPVKRQITIALAAPSIAESSPNPVSATLPAIRPTITPTVPSAVIHTRLNQDSSLARRTSGARDSS